MREWVCSYRGEPPALAGSVRGETAPAPRWIRSLSQNALGESCDRWKLMALELLSSLVCILNKMGKVRFYTPDTITKLCSGVPAPCSHEYDLLRSGALGYKDFWNTLVQIVSSKIKASPSLSQITQLCFGGGRHLPVLSTIFYDQVLLAGRALKFDF